MKNLILLLFISHLIFSQKDLKKMKNFFLITDDNYEEFMLHWDLNFIYLHKEKDCQFCETAIKTLNQLASTYNDSFSTRNRFAIILCDQTTICQKLSKS